MQRNQIWVLLQDYFRAWLEISVVATSTSSPSPLSSSPFIRAQNNKSFVCLVPRVPTSLFMMTVSRALYASCWQICMARSPSREVFSSSVFFAQSCGQRMIMETKLRIPASLIPFLYFLLSYDISVKCAITSADFLPKRL